MKHFLFLLFFIYTTIGFSQSEYQKFIDKYDEFALYAKPNKTNNLSKDFAKRIDSRLIDSYRITDTIKNKKYIYLTFNLDKSNKPIRIIVNSPYSELNKSIREAFKDFDIEDLNITEKSQLNIYTLQILSQENNKMVINCSTNVVSDRSPIFEGCESSATKSKLSSCFNSKLSEYIANTISPAEIKKAKILGKLNLRVKFLVNEKGVIEQINCKAPTDSLSRELNRIIALFPKAKSPATRNGIPTSFTYESIISLEVETDNAKYIEEINKQKEEILYSDSSLLNPNAELAVHFKKYINPDELSKIFLLNSIIIKIHFSVDKNGKPVNCRTNANSLELNNRLIEIFKKFPPEKLNINPVRVIDYYTYPIITCKFDKNIIISSEKPVVHTPPVFDKDCESCKTAQELSDCMNKKIKYIIDTNFKRTIQNKTKLDNIININFSFEIGADRNITDVKVNTPNPLIGNELEELIKSIPAVSKPKYLDGKAVSNKYKYTFRYDMRNNRVNEFKNLIKTYY